jgi:hypothetical protein
MGDEAADDVTIRLGREHACWLAMIAERATHNDLAPPAAAILATPPER